MSKTLKQSTFLKKLFSRTEGKVSNLCAFSSVKQMCSLVISYFKDFFLQYLFI